MYYLWSREEFEKVHSWLPLFPWQVNTNSSWPVQSRQESSLRTCAVFERKARVWLELSDNKHELYLSCLCEMPGHNCFTIFAQFWSLSLSMAFRGNQASTCSWLCRVWVFDFRIFITHQHSWEAGLIWSEEFWIHNVKKPGETPVSYMLSYIKAGPVQVIIYIYYISYHIYRQDQRQHTVCVNCMLYAINKQD